MSKRGDGIHKRKDGRWEGRYRKGRRPDGSICYGSVYGKSYTEVRNKMNRILPVSDTPDVIKAGDWKFGDVLELWMANNRLRLKGGTIHKYQSLIDAHILPQLGHVRMSALTATRINHFLAEKLESGRLDQDGGLSASYVRSIMVVINSAMKYAVQEKLCMPLQSPIYKPASVRHEIQVLDLEQQRKLESYLNLDLEPSKIGILLSLHTGLRIGEICALSWDDIDFKNRIIRVRHTVARIKSASKDTGKRTSLVIDSPKTRASVRDIPISSVLLPKLIALEESSVSDYVISENQSFVSPRTYEYRYHRILSESGVEQVNYHVLRHTFATRCIEAGVDIKSLSEILGHSNVSITLNTYVHSSMELKRTQLEKLSVFSV